ncbi:MAG: hypothetical protein ACFFCS_28925, partial [Candidatus Hodarchaeota archaeon]
MLIENNFINGGNENEIQRSIQILRYGDNSVRENRFEILEKIIIALQALEPRLTYSIRTTKGAKFLFSVAMEMTRLYTIARINSFLTLFEDRSLFDLANIRPAIILGFSKNAWDVNEVKHDEHIIPIKYIRDVLIMEELNKGTALIDIARNVQEHLMVLTITENEANYIDNVLGLKTEMPTGWVHKLARIQANQDISIELNPAIIESCGIFRKMVEKIIHSNGNNIGDEEWKDLAYFSTLCYTKKASSLIHEYLAQRRIHIDVWKYKQLDIIEEKEFKLFFIRTRESLVNDIIQSTEMNGVERAILLQERIFTIIMTNDEWKYYTERQNHIGEWASDTLISDYLEELGLYKNLDVLGWLDPSKVFDNDYKWRGCRS